MDLRITAQNAEIGIQQSMGQMMISNNSQTLQTNIRDPKISMQQDNPVLLIDQSQCFSEAGLKSSREISRIYAHKGKQAALQSAYSTANEGRQMANIQNGFILNRLAKSKSEPKERQFNFDMIPKSRPEIQVRRGETRFSFQKGEVQVNAPYTPPSIDYNRGNTNIYLKQKNYINIDYIGKRVDLYGG
ncbi:hypothetical protein SAMN05660297_00691 [Natronincola peptidivorans]|uniref:Uncharacterized protein n=1 Tax=Natronincola peptidivorans TaxID=426128 RepID=A0A1H9ZRG7_9FIRM|nr:DUF6470 family protein [Natronincola peptidivorans]SES84312.1 hypothetical protein SAMN05660297_00691 [Natronincola peptidivorans]